jgi:hypothetical protein
MFDWEAWARNHEHSACAHFVLLWLQTTDPSEAVWQTREELVKLVIHAWEVAERMHRDPLDQG